MPQAPDRPAPDKVLYEGWAVFLLRLSELKVNVTLTPDAEKRLKERIKAQVGAKAEKLVHGLHDEFLKNTPMNTGRTLASWRVTKNAPSNYDAGSEFEGMFEYNDVDFDRTNNRAVGSEPGRSLWEGIAKESRVTLKIRQDPYHKFYVSNAAELDPMFRSSLPQGQGSRAYNLDAGSIPGYDVYSHPNGKFIFDPRGTGFYRISIQNFLRDNKLI